MADNQYAEAARERKARSLWDALRDDNPDPTNDKIREIAPFCGQNYPSDATCARVRELAAIARGDAPAVAAAIDDRWATPDQPRHKVYTASIDYGAPGAPLTTMVGVFSACCSTIAGALATSAAMASDRTVATEFIDAQTAVNGWSETAPTCGTDWEIFADAFQAQITEAPE